MPSALREFGDKYVRSEFKRHLNAETKFLVPFFAEWEKYVMTTLDSDRMGENLKSDVLEEMTKEQKEQFIKLRRSIDELCKK